MVFENTAKISIVPGRHKKEVSNDVLRRFGFHLYKLQQDIKRKTTQKRFFTKKGSPKREKFRGLPRIHRLCQKILKIHSKEARSLTEPNFFEFGLILDKVS